MLCQECPIRSTCNSLCEKAQEYVEQDTIHLHQKEIRYGLMTNLSSERTFPWSRGLYLTPMEKEVARLMFQGCGRSEVVGRLNITARGLARILHHLKMKYIEFQAGEDTT